MKKMYSAPQCEVIKLVAESMLASSIGVSKDEVDAGGALSNDRDYESEKEFPWSK